MAAPATGRTNKHKSQQDQVKATGTAKSESERSNVQKPPSTALLAEEHLAPLSLVFCVFFLSGPLFVLGLRDMLATGRVVAGSMDEAMQQFTDSNLFYDGSDWKSTQGGLSAIQAVSTDENNMGGLFVRKLGGAAAAVVHLQKILPLLFHPEGAQWMAGHFHPMYWMALVGNLSLAAFYGLYMKDFKDSRADRMPQVIVGLLVVEALVILYHLMITSKRQSTTTRLPAIAMPEGKTPQSVSSRIVARTVAVVTSLITLIAGRDLLLPGTILEFIPRDDIYLEWTNALLHSPPPGSVESEDQGLEAALYIGDKFVSQLLALHLLILCCYKFLTAFFIKFGSDGSGQIKCRMIWKVQCLGDMALLLMLRLFSSAALSASLDFRWHLMLVAYEGFILGLYAWF